MATNAEELTNCVICAEFFTDPQVLPCEHVFCKGCVNQMTIGRKLKCPNCSKVCMTDDIKPDFRLATFLDAFAKYAENVTNQFSINSHHDVTHQHVTPPPGDGCESCEENVIDSFCHQCEQWLCTSCKKVHGKLKATKDHSYTVLAAEQQQQQLRTSLMEKMKTLNKINVQLNVVTRRHEAAIEASEAEQKMAIAKSNALRKSLHEDIDKYFDTIDEHIEDFCRADLTALTDQNSDVAVKMKACVDITASMANLTAQNERELHADGAATSLLSQATTLSQSLAGPLSDAAVKIPQVRIARGQDWSLDGAVDLHLERVPHVHVDHVPVSWTRKFK